MAGDPVGGLASQWRRPLVWVLGVDLLLLIVFMLSAPGQYPFPGSVMLVMGPLAGLVAAVVAAVTGLGLLAFPS